MATRLQIEDDDSVLLRVTHSNLKTFSASLRFSLQVFHYCHLIIGVLFIIIIIIVYFQFDFLSSSTKI